MDQLGVTAVSGLRHMLGDTLTFTHRIRHDIRGKGEKKKPTKTFISAQVAKRGKANFVSQRLRGQRSALVWTV